MSRKSQRIIDAAKWTDYGDIAPNSEMWTNSLLARFTTEPEEVLLWFRAHERSNIHPADADALEDDARFVHMHLLASALSHRGYMQFSTPQAFFNDFAIAVRVTEQGHAAASALKLGFVWNTTAHEINRPRTHTHWVTRARHERNPHAQFFRSIPSPDIDSLFKATQEEVQRIHAEVWKSRVDAMTSPWGHDWDNIVGTQIGYLSEVRDYALAQHNQRWIEELQRAKTADDKMFETISKLSDTEYRDVKNEAMFVKMRIWTPLDQNGHRMRVT
ncbi:MAG: hypothetical protein EOP83_21340 [Verrucomicrobiaceae bacterium]|nr:MAG: hypothetical protein EOP83_21340 [Verrucomicrobiaceae bacterium]